MTRTSKIALSITCVLLACIIILWLAQRLLMPKYQTGIVEGSMTEEYYKEVANHDVLMIGDCEVYENISTIEMWRKYGITSYIRGSAQQLVWQSYYLLEDSLRKETPKVVVFNVLALKYDTPQKEEYNRMTLDGMKWNMSKIKAIYASMTKDESFIDYAFPLLRYHSRWSELTKEDFDHVFTKQRVTHAGYYMRVDVKPQEDFPDPMPLADYTLGENAMSYLDKMVMTCKDKGIKLVLIKAPTEYPHWYDEWDRQIEDYAEKYGLEYINFIKIRDEIGIDMSTDTYDAGLHLNTQGAEKLASYLGKFLQDKYGLADHRMDVEYASVWSDKMETYDNMKKQQYEELEKYGKLVSFGANAVK